MVYLTLRGLFMARVDEVRRARDERAGRYPIRASLRLDRDTWRAVERVWEQYAPSLTASEVLRVLVEYAAVWAPLREELERNLPDL